MSNNSVWSETKFQPRATTGRSGQNASGLGILPQDFFLRLLCLERKRTERSGRRFVLMLVNAGTPTLPKVADVVSHSIRDTDLIGWYQEHRVIGVIFTEVGSLEGAELLRVLSDKTGDALSTALTAAERNELTLSFHLFPDDWEAQDSDGPTKSTLQVVLAHGTKRPPAALHVKRLIDIAGSLAAIVCLLPVMLAIAIAIKLTSKGPVLFRQTRLGKNGRTFTFLKFRSMHVGSSHSIHEAYVKQLICGESPAAQSCGNGRQPTYKLTADPRITPIGRLLRRTSLDELPQFFNVLKGEMSLVGPRPPVSYEYAQYGLWHKQRLLAVKPGLTGLWQVKGRSRVKFDDMVRMDIRYAKNWSIWLDLEILFQTPGAVLSGNGAW